ncbi:DUF4124 domain-containing protein, partial [Accumulibacter sp.]|uniref:DUF4124 domain-containing protein n=1 Tax=Accumulibacter sp. TaxID=2053492 RepID=UPI0025801077
MHRRHFLPGIMLIATLAAAQPVYESRDRDGPVFSDTPSPGAREMRGGPGISDSRISGSLAPSNGCGSSLNRSESMT